MEVSGHLHAPAAINQTKEPPIPSGQETLRSIFLYAIN